MAFGYVLDPIFEEHRAPRGHPECPERITAVRSAFERQGFPRRGEALPVREARTRELARVHSAPYLASLERRLPGSSGWLDAETFYSEGSWAAARAAAGAALDLSEAVLGGRFRRGAALVRPPGHHAEADRAMGFCLLNNIAVAAAMARAGGTRVSIFDWDVHHGNGTQHAFEADPMVQYISIHQFPHYPGTGAPSEVGRGAGIGSTVNLALPAGCGDGDYVAAFDLVVAPEIEEFQPGLILLSAGFDAFAGDPLAGMKLTIDGFRALSRRLVRLSERVCQGRVVAVLEGGYVLADLGRGVTALLDEMTSEEDSAEPEIKWSAGPAAMQAIDATRSALTEARGSRA